MYVIYQHCKVNCISCKIKLKRDCNSPFACGFSLIILQSFKPTTILHCTWKGNLSHTTTHTPTHSS